MLNDLIGYESEMVVGVMVSLLGIPVTVLLPPEGQLKSFEGGYSPKMTYSS